MKIDNKKKSVLDDTFSSDIKAKAERATYVDTNKPNPDHEDKVKEPIKNTVEPEREPAFKTSLILKQSHLDKLSDLAKEYRQRTGKSIDRTRIIKHLVDTCSIEDLLGA